MKITKEAEEQLRKLFTDRERAVIIASRPYDELIDTYIRGLAAGHGIDLSKNGLNFDKMEFEERKQPVPPPTPIIVHPSEKPL